MHIVIVGCGRVGSGLATTLVEQGHSVSIVDRSGTAFRRLPTGFAGTAIEGSGFDRETLLRAGIDNADALAAVTSGDNSNILCARIARETYGIERVVARIYDPRRAEVYQKLGIPTVATVTWTVNQVKSWLTPDETETEWTDTTGQLHLVNVVLPDRLAGTPLGSLETPGKLRLVAVTRAGTPRLDPAALVGQEGDLLHIAVGKKDLPLVDALVEDTAGATS